MSKMTDKEIIKALEYCNSPFREYRCCSCPLYDTDNCKKALRIVCIDLINRQQAEIERLRTIAKKMHSWIFTNSYDEEKAYAECGLTDEENTLFGYCGKIVFESKEMVGEQE